MNLFKVKHWLRCSLHFEMETLSELFKMHLLDCLPSLNVTLGRISTLAAADTRRSEVWNPERQLCPSTAVYRGPQPAMEPDAGPCQSTLCPPSHLTPSPLRGLHLWISSIPGRRGLQIASLPGKMIPLSIPSPKCLCSFQPPTSS